MGTTRKSRRLGVSPRTWDERVRARLGPVKGPRPGDIDGAVVLRAWTPQQIRVRIIYSRFDLGRWLPHADEEIMLKSEDYSADLDKDKKFQKHLDDHVREMREKLKKGGEKKSVA